MFFALKKESNAPTERKSKSLTTTPEKPLRKFSLSKALSESQPQDETSPASKDKKPFFIHLDNICNSQNKFNAKETSHFSLHTKNKTTTQQLHCSEQITHVNNTNQTGNELQKTMTEDIIESFSSILADIKPSSCHTETISKETKDSFNDALTEQMESHLSRNELETAIQLLEENYEMATTLMQKIQLTDLPEYLGLVSQMTLRIENAFQTINALVEYTENQIFSTEITYLLKYAWDFEKSIYRLKQVAISSLPSVTFAQKIATMSSTDATINSSFLEKPSFVFDIKKMNVRGKSFIKRTRKGNIAKVTKEHYLRDDIPCLSPLCTTCPHKEVKLLSNSAEFYLIPDTNIVLHQLDLLESDVVTDVILLQTVLQETRNRNMSVYERLKKLLNDQSRSFVSFSNEHHKETFIERQKDETSNDYNDRSIRVAARWYTTHLNRRKRVVLLTNDKNNAKGARGEGVEALSVDEFVTLYESRHPHIRELVAANTADSSEEQEDDRKRKFLYDEYWNTQQIQNALNANRVVEGVFHANSYNCMEGKVLYSGKSQQQSAKTILVSGIKNINRAIDGDVVFVELLPEEMWCTPSTEVKEDIEEAIEEAETSKPPSTVIQNINVRKEVTGRVVAIKRRNWRPYCGSLQAKGSSHLTLFIPVDKRIPKIRIHSRRVSDLTDKRIVVSIDSWERNSMFPSGHVIEELGVEGDIETETKVLLHENSIITRAFPKAVLECLPADDLQFSPDMLKNRKDLQSLCIFSIDPPGCTDIDDALSIQLDENHNYMVGVHIADVTSFISRDTALDKEAADRSTTVYLADRRIEMLPPRLSSDLCSLKENETRLAFSAFITIDHEGNVLHYDFARTIIRSRKAFTYAEAQDYLNQARKKETKECTEIELSLLRLMDIAQKLRKRRFENGALRLSSPEVRFETDQEGDEITNVSVYETHETNELVEEYMLLTNVVVAQRISKSFPSCALLRRHPIPNKEMFEPLLKIAAALSVEIDVSSNKQLSRSLEKIQEKFDEENDPFKATLFRISTTRCMTQALYFSAGEASQEEYFHYGLASTIYTHFTSPIRRYAVEDIIVHRMLSGSIGYTSFPDSLLNSKAIQKIADHLNERHRAAQKAARDSVALHTLRLFRGEQREEEGRVFRLLTNGIVVMLPRYGLEGLVRFEKNSSATLFDEDKQLLITPKGTRLKIFDRVRVSIQLDAQVNPAGQLVIHLIE